MTILMINIVHWELFQDTQVSYCTELLNIKWHLIFTHRCIQYCDMHYQFLSLVLVHFHTKFSMCYTGF